ncbi:hybrid sensor histidine kinase/response regulator [Confluentibacter citreus]|uniref:hybrid sensor histidine kinase/response regulator n=1 Tax=Confluentibacter citreus TaxID=2007307 RepID=UPI000C281695|nr:PAS domain S-box protein [Confluentibacter citreus]
MGQFKQISKILKFIPNSFTKSEIYNTLNCIPLPIAMVDNHQNIIFTNQQFLNFTGISDLNNTNCKNSFCNDQSCMCHVINDSTDEKSSNKVKRRFIKKDGSIAFINRITHKLEINNLVCTLIFIFDMTEEEMLKKHQDQIIKEKSIAELYALKEAKKFEFLFENLGDALYLLNKKGNVVKVNEKTTQYLGYTKDELLKMNILDINEPKNILKSKRILKNIKKDKKLLFETTHVTKNGDIKTVEVTSRYIKLNNEDFIFSSVRDITQRKKMEQDLIFSKEKAQESEKLKYAFLNNISHQVRTPLSGILGMMDLLESNYTDLTLEKRTEYFEIIRKCSDRLLNTIEDVIEVSKLSSGTAEPKSSSFSLKAEIEKVIKEVKEIHIENRNTFYLEMDSSVTMIKTDKAILMRVLKNLMDNAFKFNFNKNLKLTIQNREENIFFSMEDDGNGIQETYINNIFEPFTQTEFSLNQAINGSGLGLTISKNIVSSLGGDLKVENLDGKGIKFYFTIPNILANEFGTGEEKLKNKTILIAEDDLVTYLFLKNLLEGEGCFLIHALNGKEAVEKFENNKQIDLIIMDINMPIMDGLTATQAIRNTCSEIPILAHSAFVHDQFNDNCLNYGFNDFIEKPVKKKILLEKIITYTKNKGYAYF